MNRTVIGFGTLLWVAALFIPAAPAQPNLDRRTTINVTGAAPRDVYGSLSRTLGCELVLAQEVQQPVTMHLDNVTVRTVLTALSENLGCRWRIDGNMLHVEHAGSGKPGAEGVTGGVPGGITGGVAGGVKGGVSGGVGVGVGRGVPGGIVGGVPGSGARKVDFKERLERKTPANFRFVNTPLRSVTEALGKIADLDIQVDAPAATQNLTVDLSDRTIVSALKAIGEQVGIENSLVFTALVSKSKEKIQLRIGARK